MTRLEPFIGEWRLETSFAPPGAVRATSVFEWALGGAFLVERSEVDVPQAPDGLCVYAVDAAGDGYTQHYFDSRGVVRLYRMTFDGRTWTLTREEPDFTPLDFAQKFEGTLSDDGDRIDGRFYTSHDGGATWELEVELTYTRRA